MFTLGCGQNVDGEHHKAAQKCACEETAGSMVMVEEAVRCCFLVWVSWRSEDSGKCLGWRASSAVLPTSELQRGWPS